jgi:sulfite reductase (NADPH) hemoprotein beta-component
MSEQSPVERIKTASRFLRGTLAESLADSMTGAIREDDQTLIKFHGSYQQDDRDVRDERRRQKLEPAYSFMIRMRLPGGVCTTKQWQQIDEIARRYANGTMRLTTRQTFQLHGIVKTDLKTTMAAINAAAIDTIAACGDVNRNVISSSNPVESRAHAAAYEWAKKLSEHLLPRTRAYHEIWLDGEKVAGTPDVEPRTATSTCRASSVRDQDPTQQRHRRVFRTWPPPSSKARRPTFALAAWAPRTASRPPIRA